MPKIKPNAWDREGASIKLIVENINKGIDIDKAHIINLVNHFRTSDYPEGIALSESDIFLLYCKLIENNRNDIVDELCLIEDLVELEEEYTYEVVFELKPDPSKVWIPQRMEFSLLGFCMFHKVDWKDIAYIQQHRKVENTAEIKFTLALVSLNSLGMLSLRQEDLTKTFADYYPEVFKKYAPYLGMGDVYVDFINKKDGWDEKINELYKEYPKGVNAYLEYMTQHFALAIENTAKGSGDVFKSNKEWLETYAKALRNMTETVIALIKNKRCLTQEDKRQFLYEVSMNVYPSLLGCKNKFNNILDKKPCDKLMAFIESLQKNIDKIAPIQAQTNTQFFQLPNASSDTSMSLEEVAEQTQTQLPSALKP